MWLLLGYPSNILGYPSKYWNYTSKKQFGWFPHSPRLPPVDKFFTLHLTFFLLKIKDVNFDFRMGCILVLFPFLLIINVEFTDFGFWIFEFWIFEFWIFEFWIFLFSNIAILAYQDQGNRRWWSEDWRGGAVADAGAEVIMPDLAEISLLIHPGAGSP